MSAVAMPPTMGIPEILAKLTPYTGKFPEQAVRAAMAQPEAIVPHLLRALEEVAEAPENFAERNDYMLHTFATYLLAQFREKRAYPLLVRIVAEPPDIVDKLFGDTITNRLKNILASVYDGDPEPLKRLVVNDAVDEYVRGAAVETFLVLAHTQQIAREAVSDYFKSLFQGKLRREFNQVWNDLACAVADLPAPELLAELRLAYAQGLVDPWFAGLEDLERDAQVPFEHKEGWERKKSDLVGDTVSEMSWWAAFHRDEPWPRPRPMQPRPAIPKPPPEPPQQAAAPPAPSAGLRSGPKIGRNDPCPCGSGKKYKKCCLGKPENN